MQKFSTIHQRAMKRKGEQALEELLPVPKTKQQLQRVKNDRYLAEMTKCVFRAGFVWQIIESKWPGFEAAFHGFDVKRCQMTSDEELEALGKDARIVRNAVKIRSVRDNANFVAAVSDEHGSFGKYVATWPEDNIVGLWDELKARGARLGGNSGIFFLRFMGKDTFMLSPDVVKALIMANVIDKKPTSKKALAAVQAAFNAWREETGRPLCQLSRIASNSVD